MSKIERRNLKRALKSRAKLSFEDWLLYALYNAYLDARKGKLRTPDENRFEMNLMANLVQLRDDIVSRRYELLPGIAFLVKEPVWREVVAASFRDRIVHHFLYDQVADWWIDNVFIQDTYSCIPNRGTLYGAERLQKAMRKVSKGEREEAWVFKFDIQSFFMNLDRQALYDQVCWGLDQQLKGSRQEPRKDLLRYLWGKVIFSDPMLGVHMRGSAEEWALLPKRKSLLYQPEGIGICIGNLTSQLLSNIYLSLLDNFIMEELGFKFYGRYVDDFAITVSGQEKERLIACIPKIEEFLHHLGLNLHPDKREVREVREGVEFVGFKVYPNRLLPGKRLKKNFKRACLRVAQGRGDIDSVIAYMGLLKHTDARKFEKKVFDSLGWRY